MPDEVGLPQLIGGRRLVLELIGRLHDDEGRAGDQVVCLEQPINRCLRHKVLLQVGEARRKLSRRQLRLVESQLEDLLANIIGDAVPHPPGSG
jgi:hypothetical protein